VAVLVVGVGYIGAALTASILRDGQRVVGLDNGFATDLGALRHLSQLGDFRLVTGSVTSARCVARAFARERVDTVYLLAAQASAHPLAAPPHYTERTNLGGPRVVLDAAVRRGVERVVYGSSLRVYGQRLPERVDETLPYGPQGDLAHLSHVYGEKLVELYARRAGIRAAAVRLAVVYGVGPVMKTDYRFMTVPNKFCLQAVRREPLEVHAGAPATAFIHLDDASAALRAAALGPMGFQAVNAAGEVTTLTGLAAEVARAAAARGLRVHVQGSRGEAPEPPVVIESRLAATGWRPTRSLGTSLGALLDHFRAREAA
jgi:nucleoside-diphosphate-sugar epimerase